MEIWEEGKASAEFIKNWTESGSVDFDVNNSRNKIKLREILNYWLLPTGHLERGRDLEL